MDATPESVSQQQAHPEEEDSSNRQQSNIRNILEQVKSGQKNKSEAFHELRNILQSTVRKTGTDFSSSSIQQGSDGETSSLPINTGLNTSSDGPRFTNEDRRILINHIIERKKRTEDDTVVAHGGLDPDNDTLPSSTVGVGMQHHRYRQEDEERPLSPSSSISGATRSLTGTHGRSRSKATGGSSTRRDNNNAHSQPSHHHQDRMPSGAMYSVNGPVNPNHRGLEPESDHFPSQMDNSYGTRGGGGNSSGGYSGYDVRQRYDMDDMDAANGAMNSRYSYPGNDFFSDARSNRMVSTTDGDSQTIREPTHTLYSLSNPPTHTLYSPSNPLITHFLPFL